MNAEEKRQQWLSERRTGIGGSDVAAILGISPFRTPVDVWLDKTGRSTEEEPNESMILGTFLENLVADRYEDRTGRTVNRFTRMLRKGHLLGNIDRLVVPAGAKVASHKGEIRTDTLLECKTTSQEAWPDEVPAHYQTQVQHYMGLDPSLEHADVAVLFLSRNKRLEIYRVERNQKIIDSMQAFLEDWWARYVAARVPPPCACEEDCRTLWAVSKEKQVEAGDKSLENVRRLLAARDAEDKAKAELESCRSLVMAEMQDADTLVDASGKKLVSWKSCKDKEVTDWKAIAEELRAGGDIIAAHTKTVPGPRTFRVCCKPGDIVILGEPAVTAELPENTPQSPEKE